MTANKNVAKDLSSYGGAYNGALIDSAVQEYNLKTGKLLRSWDALDHIPLEDSYASVPTNGFPWDAYHVNSIALTGKGDFLVSMRNTWAAYLVNIASGQIEWTLGGRSRASRSAPAPTSSGSTTLPWGGWAFRFRNHDVRRSLLSADRWRHIGLGDRGLARACAERGPERAHSDTRGPVRRRGQVRNRIHGRHAAAPQSRHIRGLGARNPTSRSTGPRANSCWRQTSPGLI